METIAELDLIILSYLVPLMSLLCGFQYNSYVIIIIMTCCGLHPLPTKCLEVATHHQQTIKIGFHPIAVNNYVVRV